MEHVLTNQEIRLLGCLIEKEMATPEYYPLSMNALVNACNQKSNRAPVVAWDQDTVLRAIESLKEKELVFQTNLSRVPKYEELFIKNNDLIPSEAAILGILMLRGPQTAGEIRGRTERLFAFENLEAVNNTLENLISLNHVMRLQRQPGRKEVRYCHMLESSTEALNDMKNTDNEQPPVSTIPDNDRIAALEEKVLFLESELKEMKQLFKDFKEQFE